jgi:hypothetical protein
VKVEGSNVIFESTGRSVYTFGDDFIPNYNEDVCYGSDGGFDIIDDRERKEMYDYMIDKWNKWLKKELAEEPSLSLKRDK